MNRAENIIRMLKGVIVIATIINYISPALERISGYKPEELRDVNVQQVRLAAVPGAPHLAQQRLVRDELALVDGENTQELELMRGQMDGLAGQSDRALVEIENSCSSIP